jgi:hypothetical protein
MRATVEVALRRAADIAGEKRERLAEAQRAYLRPIGDTLISTFSARTRCRR